jgi:hypothetical protein
LGDMQVFGGARKIEPFSHGNKIDQMAKFHYSTPRNHKCGLLSGIIQRL